jgi:hypothetical protein
MEESVRAFLFPKLCFDKYLTLDVLMNVEYETACEFIFYVNKAARSFLEFNASTILNGFINNGLIEYKFKFDYDGYQMLERLYM